MKKRKEPLGGGINRADAIKLIRNYKKKYNHKGKSTIHITFTVEEVRAFMATVEKLSDHDLVRFYLGLHKRIKSDPPGQRRTTVVIVLAKPDGHGTRERTKPAHAKDDIGWDFGTLCPPQCCTPDVDSLAYEVYPSARKPGPCKETKARKSSKSKR